MSQTSNDKMLPTEDQIAELTQCLNDLLSELEALTKCQKTTYGKLNSTIDSINKRITPLSSLVTIATAGAVCSVMPLTFGLVLVSAVTGLTAGDTWKFFWEWRQRSKLKEELEGCKCDGTADDIRGLQDKWKSLMEKLSIIFPGMDYDMSVGKPDMISIPDITPSPFLDTVCSRTADASMGLPGLLFSFKRLFTKCCKQDSIEDGFLVLLNHIMDVEQIRSNFAAFLFNIPTKEGVKLRSIADEIKKKLKDNVRILESIKEHPRNPYTKEGVDYLIKKSEKVDWSLSFDDKSDSLDVVLCFDGKPLFSLKPGGEKRALGPTDARVDVLPIQEIDIGNDEEKEKARNKIEALFGLKAEDTQDRNRFQNWLDSTLRKDETVQYQNLRETLDTIDALGKLRHRQIWMKKKSLRERLVRVEPIRRRQVQSTTN